MITPALRVKIETVKKLVRKNARTSLEKVLAKLHPADIALIIKNLSDLDRKKIWESISDKSKIASIILELEDSQIIEFFDAMQPNEIALILNEMESDDAANILRLLDQDKVNEILKYMKKDEVEAVEELLHYPEDSAGAVMNPNFFALHEDTTIKEATKVLHKAEDVEMVFYLYVVDDEGRLVGVISLRQLILNPPEKKLKEIMTKDVIRVTVDMDREDVAKIVEKYDLLAIPVVDEQNRLVGIITVDDIIDIIREEATEDIYKMAGTTDDEVLMGNKSIKIARVRLPWLLITFVGELISGFVITFFQGRVHEFAILASFMPLIMAMGGNVGSQSATILIRGMALGKIDSKDLSKVIFKEIRVGMIMGLIMGILLALVAPIWHGDPKLGIVVGCAMFAAVTFSTFTGTFVPATLIRFNFDPAVASSPFISTLNDITGLTIYFTVSIVLLSIL
ncbi:magnesium transporter [Deferribacter autotrophicus]|uniref:Magnesium transporter MgtE n=1 Tax=Deferribacter autotrophicus TaxID=500465 RepID=A0A5A8F949_9BACT|nr:magnesium transporter [Deferribacter autotrophicus]KAA0259472.1 magnesium transporter [Deferribacter autotrophicus]